MTKRKATKTKKASRKTSTSKRTKVVTLTMDQPLKDVMQGIATDAGTDIATVAQVFIVSSMYHGRSRECARIAAERDQLRGDLKTTADVLQDFEGEHVWQQAQNALRKLQDAEMTLGRCRAVMECNDPGNARDIFGDPLTAKAEAETAQPEAPQDAASVAPPAGGA
jgi:hypothetical protein